jgi:hypothetical protein
MGPLFFSPIQGTIFQLQCQVTLTPVLVWNSLLTSSLKFEVIQPVIMHLYIRSIPNYVLEKVKVKVR